MPSAYIKSKMKHYIKENEVMQALQSMMDDESFHSKPGYSVNTDNYPDHAVPFAEWHLNYLKTHPQVDPQHYLANLRLMLKVR